MRRVRRRGAGTIRYGTVPYLVREFQRTPIVTRGWNRVLNASCDQTEGFSTRNNDSGYALNLDKYSYYVATLYIVYFIK
jgi:hypothetical protein